MGKHGCFLWSVLPALVLLCFGCSGVISFHIESTGTRAYRWEFDLQNDSSYPLQLNVNGRVSDELLSGEGTSVNDPLQVKEFAGQPFFFALRSTDGQVPLTMVYPSSFDGSADHYRLTINSISLPAPVTVDYDLVVAP